MTVQDLCLPLSLPFILAEHVDSILLRLLRSRMCNVLAGEPGDQRVATPPKSLMLFLVDGYEMPLDLGSGSQAEWVSGTNGKARAGQILGIHK